MLAEISRDGMLTIFAQTETERYAMKQWFASYSRGDSSPSPWGICADYDARSDPEFLYIPEAK